MRFIKLFEEHARNMRSKTIKVFYTPKQVLQDVAKSYSKSPLKPMLLMQNFTKLGMDKHLDVDSDFVRFEREDFLVAHTPEYVDAVLTGKDEALRSSNSIPWTAELAETVRYTNSSLYNAIKYSLEHPETPCFSPTSGFHHAHADRGAGFCTFAGQVIASVKLYRAKGVKGAYFDLDGHYGNSIEDCRGYVKDLDSAIPRGFNINPQGRNEDYLAYLSRACDRVGQAIMDGQIDYVVWCHGADSHEHDDLGGQVNTEYWVKCAEEFYIWVKSMDDRLAAVGRGPLPLTCSLFGGYRKDSYESVLSLHTKDMALCLNILCGHGIKYEARVKAKHIEQEASDEISKEEENLLHFLHQQGSDNLYSAAELKDIVAGWDKKSVEEMEASLERFVEEGYLEGSPEEGYRYK